MGQKEKRNPRKKIIEYMVPIVSWRSLHEMKTITVKREDWLQRKNSDADDCLTSDNTFLLFSKCKNNSVIFTI